MSEMKPAQKTLQIQLAGVGGQGIISVGRLLLAVGQDNGFEVKGNETHGMSQRGGSVVFQVRIGNFKGVLIPDGEADVILATEPMEAVRNLNILKKGGIIITDTHHVIPAIANVLDKPYPDDELLYQTMKKKTDKIYKVPAREIAERIGNIKGANLVLLGALVEITKFFDPLAFEKRIAEKWPKVKEKNLEAFRKGMEFAMKLKLQ